MTFVAIVVFIVCWVYLYRVPPVVELLKLPLREQQIWLGKLVILGVALGASGWALIERLPEILEVVQRAGAAF